MNIAKTASLRRFAALLVLGSCSALAGAAEIDASSVEAAKDANAAARSIQTTTAKLAFERVAQDDACRSGACDEPGSTQQQADAMVGAELLPQLGLQALLGTEKADEGC